ncbi:YceI family protein [Ramlibacter sp. PS4R-6]|uniref:YceI family protein n=1 Tax=Ramlibacter sp. PS4R-6 TaxID=3133438 RepID=UPI0030B25B4C
MKTLPKVLLSLLAPLPVLAAPVTYNVDPVHSFPNFAIGHFGMSTIHGRFEEMNGRVVLDVAEKTGSVDIRIKAATVNTGDAKHEPGSFAARNYGPRSRDEHLRSADFFNVAEFPEITFKSTKLTFSGEALESVEGNLTMVGVTRPVKLRVTLFKCGPNPFSKKPMCGADLEGSIKRTDFGLKFGVPAISDEVKLSIGVEAYPE